MIKAWLWASTALVLVSCSGEPPLRQRAPAVLAPTSPAARPPPVTAQAEPPLLSLLSPSTPDAASACVLPTEQVIHATEAVLEEARGAERVAVTSRPWDRKTAPRHLDRVVSQLGLTARERRLLESNGFVVLGRTSFGNYGKAFHEIHRRELPLYVSADAVLHALFVAEESFLQRDEGELADSLSALLPKLHAALPAAAPRYAPEVTRDLDLYIGVARRLAAAEEESHFGTAAEAATLTSKVEKGRGLETIELFGRPRRVDFTQFTPRGHYQASALQTYYRASMWLSRIELNLVSRSTRSSSPERDPRETPREAALALSLADLAAQAGLLDDLAAIDSRWRALSGPREEVPLEVLARIAATVSDLRDVDAAAATLRAAIGDGHRRTIAFQPMPYGTGELPAISTVLGVGITPDAVAFPILQQNGEAVTRLVRGADLAFILGHDRAARYVHQPAVVRAARETLVGTRTGPDLYASRLTILKTLAAPVAGAHPTFMDGAAYADLRLSSALVGYGQLRHTFALYAMQAYDYGGCEIPDAFVEPTLPLYDALLAHARFRASNAGADVVISDYYTRFIATVEALRTIVIDELAGLPLSETQRRFLAMVSELVPPNAYEGGPAHFNGWYPRLFPEVMQAFTSAAFVSDVATSPTHRAITYVGATEPRLGLFVVDAGGEARVMVGPVARGFDRIGGLTQRLTDDDLRTYEPELAAWQKSYLVPGPSRLALEVEISGDTAVVRGDPRVGSVVVEALDEHGDAYARGRGPVSAVEDDGTRFPLEPLTDGTGWEARVRLSDGSVYDGSSGLGPRYEE